MDLSNEDILELINRLLDLPVHQPLNRPNYQNH